MGNSRGRMKRLFSLAVAAVLCSAGTVAYAATLAVSSPNGTAPSSVTFNVTLSTGGQPVGGAQADIAIGATDPLSLPSAASGTGTCSPKGYCNITTATQCSTNNDCPTGTCSTTTATHCHSSADCPSGESCQNAENCVTACLSDGECKNGASCQIAQGAKCVPGTSLGDKQALFSFPKNCSATTSQQCVTDADCQTPVCTTCQAGETCPAQTTKLRGIVAGINPPKGSCSTTTTTPCVKAADCPSGETCKIDPIPDGTVLYTCTVDIKSGASDGTYPLTISNVQVSDTAGTLVSGSTGTGGNVRVGPPPSGWAECDVVPSSGDDAGQFGTMPPVVNIFDVRGIFAAAQLNQNRPANGTARFSAMDSVTVDNPTTCGGNSTLNIFDVRQCFGVAQLSYQNYTRSSTGTDCKSAAIAH